jgi:hypothetical protein
MVSAQENAVSSVADPDPRSGAFFTLDPGSGMCFPDPGSRIPNPKPVFLIANDNFWIKSTTIVSILVKKILCLFKNIFFYNFMIFDKKMVGQKNFLFSW